MGTGVARADALQVEFSTIQGDKGIKDFYSTVLTLSLFAHSLIGTWRLPALGVSGFQG